MIITVENPQIIKGEWIMKNIIKTDTDKSVGLFEKSQRYYEAGEYENAFVYCMEAAENGHMNAMFYLGHFYEKGHGVEENPSESFKWLEKAAELGDAESMFSTGANYAIGYGVKENPEESFNWMRKGAELGNANCMFGLGLCYAIGYGTVTDTKEGLKWVKLSEENGIEDAMEHWKRLFGNDE